MCSNIGACGSGGFSWSPDANMGYDEFDAIVDAAGTYISYDIYGRANFGFSHDLDAATKNVIDSIRSAVTNPNSGHGITDRGPYPWDGFQVYIHQTSDCTTPTGLIPDYIQSIADVADVGAYAREQALKVNNPEQRMQILVNIISGAETLINRQSDVMQALWEFVLRNSPAVTN